MRHETFYRGDILRFTNDMPMYFSRARKRYVYMDELALVLSVRIDFAWVMFADGEIVQESYGFFQCWGYWWTKVK